MPKIGFIRNITRRRGVVLGAAAVVVVAVIVGVVVHRTGTLNGDATAQDGLVTIPQPVDFGSRFFFDDSGAPSFDRPATRALFASGKLSGIVISTGPSGMIIAVPDLNDEYDGKTPQFAVDVTPDTTFGMNVQNPELVSEGGDDGQGGDVGNEGGTVGADQGGALPDGVSPFIVAPRDYRDFASEDVVDVTFRVEDDGRVIADSVTFLFSIAEGSGYELLKDNPLKK